MGFSELPRMNIPIGRFSKMTRLSLKALRLYGEIGLLSPAYVDPSSGYRYYSLDQAGRAEAIRLLRSVDMPLDEIRVLLDSESESAVSQQLQAHRTRLEAQISAQRLMLANLDSILESKSKLTDRDVFLAESDVHWAASVRKRTTLRQIKDDVQSAFSTIGFLAQEDNRLALRSTNACLSRRHRCRSQRGCRSVYSS